MKKLLFCPFIGDFPNWIDKYFDNIKNLDNGWEVKILSDRNDFEQRVKKILNITPNIPYNTCKISDYRPMLGLLYQDILDGYEFWGHTDIDCVYGRLYKFIIDPLLSNCDIYSNDIGHMCGPMSLYRNNPKINNLFKDYPNWQKMLENPQHFAFDEQGISDVVNKHHELKIEYHHWQGKNPDIISNLSYKNNSLFDGKDEIMYFHFNHIKKWPL